MICTKCTIGDVHDAGIPHGGAHARRRLVDLLKAAEMLERQGWRMCTADGERRACPPATCARGSLRAFEHDPMRRHAAFGAARHHEADLRDLLIRQEALEKQLQRQRGVAAAEVVDETVALGFREHGEHAFRIDPARGDGRLDAGHVVGRVGGDAVDLGDGHGVAQ